MLARSLMHPRARSVLVVGCGAGITAGSFVPYKGVERIAIVEIGAHAAGGGAVLQNFDVVAIPA